MFVTIKKKTIIIVAIIILAVIAVGVTIGIVAASTESVPQNGKTIVIDAGHGGRDGGVTGVGGVAEADINLAIARHLQRFLQAKGYRVVMTRTDSAGLYDPNCDNKKISDMNRRVAIIEEAKPDLVVSIHQNSYPNSRVRGPRVFFANNSEAGRAAANHVQASLNRAVSTSGTAAVGDYFILERNSFPSVLIECGFLTNPEEARLLTTPQYQEKIAYAIFFAIHSLLYDGNMVGVLLE